MQPPGDERRPGIGPEAQAVGHPGGNGHDVLDRPAKLHPAHVRGGVGPEIRRGQGLLDLLAGLFILAGQGHGRGHLPDDLVGKGGTGEHGEFRLDGGQFVLAHLGHGHERVELDALARADHHGIFRKMLEKTLIGLADELAGHGEDEMPHPVGHGSRIGAHHQIFRQFAPGQVPGIFVCGADLVHDRLFAHPQSGILAFLRQQVSQGRAPASAADHRDLHALLLPARPSDRTCGAASAARGCL